MAELKPVQDLPSPDEDEDHPSEKTVAATLIDSATDEVIEEFVPKEQEDPVPS
jgi:hypothetical protein